MNEALVTISVAVIAALGGGTLTELIRRLFDKNTVDSDIGLKLRNELRGDVDKLRGRIESLEVDRDEWRQKYWGEVEKTGALERKIDILESRVIYLESKLVSTNPKTGEGNPTK